MGRLVEYTDAMEASLAELAALETDDDEGDADVDVDVDVDVPERLHGGLGHDPRQGSTLPPKTTTTTPPQNHPHGSMRDPHPPHPSPHVTAITSEVSVPARGPSKIQIVSMQASRSSQGREAGSTDLHPTHAPAGLSLEGSGSGSGSAWSVPSLESLEKVEGKGTGTGKGMGKGGVSTMTWRERKMMEQLAAVSV